MASANGWFNYSCEKVVSIKKLGFYPEIVCSGMCILWIIVRMLKKLVSAIDSYVKGCLSF